VRRCRVLRRHVAVRDSFIEFRILNAIVGLYFPVSWTPMSLAQLDIQPVLIEQVENRLIDAIVDGTLAAGQRLTQESVAAMLGVSRQPVSHALHAIDAQRLRDLYQVRAALDGIAAELAAERVRSNRAPVDVIAACRTALLRGQALEPSATLHERIGCDVAFHGMIHQLSGNAAITETVAAQWPHFMRSMALVLDDPVMRARVWDEHAAILDAVLLKQPQNAADLARAHTARAGEETARRLENRAAQAATGT
jgi:DNA-binding GntR family transcriptional regulator